MLSHREKCLWKRNYQSCKVKWQCCNIRILLGDQAQNYQSVAEKAAVHCTQYKYKKIRGKVNKKKMLAAIIAATPDSDSDKLDNDI